MSTPEHELILAVDVGNNQIKMALFSSTQSGALPRPDRVRSMGSNGREYDGLAQWLPATTTRWAVATVRRDAETRLAEWVRSNRPTDAYRRLEYRQLPICIRVEVPEQVGMDRLLAAVAANRLRQAGRPAVVVDAGSAITVDLVSTDGAFEGGVILPGFGMTARALACGTDLLPLIGEPVPVQAPPVLGKSTEGAIRSGLFWGSVGAVREVVSRVSRSLDVAPQLIVAGGDAEKLAPYLNEAVLVVPDLVLAGIAIVCRELGD
jgi:type III pantothenate kinase